MNKPTYYYLAIGHPHKLRSLLLRTCLIPLLKQLFHRRGEHFFLSTRLPTENHCFLTIYCHPRNFNRIVGRIHAIVKAFLIKHQSMLRQPVPFSGLLYAPFENNRIYYGIHSVNPFTGPLQTDAVQKLWQELSIMVLSHWATLKLDEEDTFGQILEYSFFFATRRPYISSRYSGRFVSLDTGEINSLFEENRNEIHCLWDSTKSRGTTSGFVGTYLEKAEQMIAQTAKKDMLNEAETDVLFLGTFYMIRRMFTLSERTDFMLEFFLDKVLLHNTVLN